MTPTHTPTRKIASAAIGLILLLAAPARAQNYTVAPTPFQTALDNSGHIINNACVWTYSAGTTTVATTYSDNIGTSNANPIRSDPAGRFTVYLLAGSSYKFVYESACTPPAHGTTLRTADNIAGVPASAATVDFTCTAGETISAGQAVYLSDGSGSKTAGQCFKADSAQAYSSTSAQAIGIAPAAIATSSAGTIRLVGPVTGLTALVVGSKYYVGTAGAITATAPVQARLLGIADTATSFIVKNLAPPMQAWADDFRLTLTSGTCVTTADVTAATTIFLSPCGGNRLDLPDSSGNPQRVTSAEFSIAVPATTSQMYDIFGFLNGATATLELLAWTNDTTRATAIVRTNGRWMKSGDSTRMYLGSFRTTTVSGQTEDSAAKRYLWNYYNRVPVPVLKFDSTDSWGYTSTTIRQANGAAANQVDIVVGLAESTLDLSLTGISTGAAGNISVGIGEDVTNAYTTGAQLYSLRAGDGNFITLTTRLVKMPAIGRHFYSWNESGNATNVFYGDNGGTTQAGLLGLWAK